MCEQYVSDIMLKRLTWIDDDRMRETGGRVSRDCEEMGIGLWD